MVFLHAIEGVISLLLIGLVGYIVARKGWVTQESKDSFPKIVTYISLPLYLLYSLTGTFKRDELIQLIYGSVVPLLSMLICWGISLVLGKVMNIKKKHIGLFYTTFVTSNAVFIGIPVNIALFGEVSLPYALLYFFANTLFLWSVGHYYISADSAENTAKMFSIMTLKKLFSAPVIAFITSIVLILLDITLPGVLMNSARYLGNMTPPLAVMFIGMTFYGIDFKKIRLDQDVLCVMVGRFIISPLSILLVAWFIPIPALMLKVFIIQSALPAVVQTVVLSSFYKTDTEYATIVVSMTTIASIITIPLLMMLIS